ncbi:Autophagy-related protein 22-like protein [Tylopilus felleus]
MLFASSSKHEVRFEDSTEVKDIIGDTTLVQDTPEKTNQSTSLIATAERSEPIVTRKELWSYYLYCNGDNIVGPMVYTPTLFLNLATAAGYDPVAGPGSSCRSSTNSGQCVLPWMGGTKPVSSIFLIANGIGFAIMTVIFTTIGPVADYGTYGRWILLSLTVICWAAQYACMALTSPASWKLALGLYILSFVSCGGTLAFLISVFPTLARNTARCRSLRERHENGQISVEEYEREESLEKNRISNATMMHTYIGYAATYLLTLALLLAPKTANDPKVDNYTIVLCNSYWVLLGIWWFIFQQPRPGPPLPKGQNCLTLGWKQIWVALKTYKHLPHTFMYIFAFFFLSDGFNTTITLVSICQNDQVNFSFLENTYLGLAQAFPSIFSILVFWYVQRHWKISTKKMFLVTVVVTVLVPLWGMVGIWTNKFGFRNVWEYWAYNVLTGVFQAPYYAYSQTMMAELSPPGFEYMFFGLFNLSYRVSSAVGPYVVQAIIDKTHNNWQGFPFLFAICTASLLVIWFGVDVEKGRRDAVKWAAAQRG